MGGGEAGKFIVSKLSSNTPATPQAKSKVMFGTESSYDLANFLTVHGKGPAEVCADIDAVKALKLEGACVAAVGEVDAVGGAWDL